jgi:hypothetical protein
MQKHLAMVESTSQLLNSGRQIEAVLIVAEIIQLQPLVFDLISSTYMCYLFYFNLPICYFIISHHIDYSFDTFALKLLEIVFFLGIISDVNTMVADFSTVESLGSEVAFYFMSYSIHDPQFVGVHLSISRFDASVGLWWLEGYSSNLYFLWRSMAGAAMDEEVLVGKFNGKSAVSFHHALIKGDLIFPRPNLLSIFALEPNAWPISI